MKKTAIVAMVMASMITAASAIDLSVERFEADCGAGLQVACVEAGHMYLIMYENEGKDIKTLNKAIELFEKACKLGNESGCKYEKDAKAIRNKSGGVL